MLGTSPRAPFHHQLCANLNTSRDISFKYKIRVHLFFQVRVALLQRARYRSKYRGSIRERTSYRKVTEVSTKEDLPAHWAMVWDQQSIHVPPLPPPIDNCA